MGGMNHDPLCPVIPADDNFSDWGCQCWLIAKVRADTLDKAYDWLSDFTPAPISADALGADAFRAGYDLGRIRSREALNAMRGVRV